ncbi:MAG: hypothetical protein KDA89_15385, partial [Planctomycetaceae bacterium]|nr:hypothetical protein [Planctomycetaceae bacterium]
NGELGDSGAVEKTGAEDTLSQSLYLVIATDTTARTSYRLGNAFAIDERRVVTSASVVKAMNDLKADNTTQDFREFELYSPIRHENFRIENAVVHPDYDSFAETAAESARQVEAIMAETAAADPDTQDAEAVKKRVLDLQMKAMTAFEQRTACDVAVLRVAEDLPFHLSGSTSQNSLRPKQKLIVAACAFDAEDPFFSPLDDMPEMRMETRIFRIHPGTGRHSVLVISITENPERQREYAFSGAPVLNDSGQVVAVYSLPTPPPLTMNENPAKAAEITTFDATLFDRVRECPNGG